MSQLSSPLPPVPPPPSPAQIRCFGCKSILTVTPPPGAMAFSCPICQLEQYLPPELRSNLNLNHIPSPTIGFDPNPIVMVVRCCVCMTIFDVPCDLIQFKCPVCEAELMVNISLLRPFTPALQVIQEMDDSAGVEKLSTDYVTSPIEDEPLKNCAEEIKEEDVSLVDVDLNKPSTLGPTSCSEELLPVQLKDEPDIVIVSEQGQVVACRDFPHPRHLCAKYPFHKTPRHNFCDRCYCCLCDAPAPCNEWSEGSIYIKHCEANAADIKVWKDLIKKKQRNMTRYQPYQRRWFR